MARVQLNSNALLWAGYAGFFIFCFALFSYLTFPYARLRDFAQQEVATRTGTRGRGGQPGMKLEIGELSPSFRPGVVLSAVKLTDPGSNPDVPSVVSFDAAAVHPAIFGLLLGKVGVDFEATAGAGGLEGSYRSGQARQEIALAFDALDTERIGLGARLQVPIKGTLSGTVDLLLPADPRAIDGDIALRIEGLELGDGKAKVPVPGMRDGLTVEKISAGTLVLEVEIRQGQVAIKKLTTDGKDLKVEGSGSIKLGDTLAKSRMDVTIELNFSEGYKTRDERTKGLFQLIGFQPELKAATTAAGGMRFRITGSLVNPKAKALGNARGGSGAGKPRR